MRKLLTGKRKDTVPTCRIGGFSFEPCVRPALVVEAYPVDFESALA